MLNNVRCRNEPHPIYKLITEDDILVLCLFAAYFSFCKCTTREAKYRLESTLSILNINYYVLYIVYILTDDQDIRLGSLDVQPKLRSLVIEQGLMFENAYVTTPVCCPSRCAITLVSKCLQLFQKIIHFNWKVCT